MEKIVCNLCGSNNYKQFLIREDLNLFIEGQFQLVQCTKCGLVYQNPRPTPAEIFKYYSDNYNQYNIAVEDEKNILVKLGRCYGLQKRAKVIQQQKKNGKLLDIGCATGDFIVSMQKNHGWQVSGVEPNQRAANYIRDRFEIKVYNSFQNEPSLDDHSFDVVTLWNVIEHLPNPSEALENINRLMTQDGLLVISTPNLNSLNAALFGKYWIGYELPRHLYIFSLETLSPLLAKTGFKVIKTLCLYGEHAAVASSIRFLLRAKHPRRQWSKTVEKLLFSYPVRILFAPYFFITARLLGHCSAPTILAIKNH